MIDFLKEFRAKKKVKRNGKNACRQNEHYGSILEYNGQTKVVN